MAEALLLSIGEAFSCAAHVRNADKGIDEIRARYLLLTNREQDVFALLLEGLPTKVINNRLGISTRTTEHHRAAVMQKMQTRNIADLVRMALRVKGINNIGENA
jgi:FixJ family two-component response regulator